MLTWHKNKVIRYTLIAVLITSNDCFGQSWEFGFSSGIGTYSYQELHDYQNYLLGEIPVNATITDAFPSYLIFELNALYQSSAKFQIGTEIGHGSTAGRIYYEDYSGKIVFDQIVKYNYVSISPGIYLWKEKNWQLSASMKTALLFQNVDIKNELKIGDEALIESQNFRAINIGLQPVITLKKYINSFLVKISSGYEIQSSSDLKTSDDDALYLLGENNQPVSINGQGWRLTLGIGIRF